MKNLRSCRHTNRSVQEFYNLFYAPNMVRNASFHRRSNAQRLVNPAEIVVQEVERDSVSANCVTTPVFVLAPFGSTDMGFNNCSNLDWLLTVAR